MTGSDAVNFDLDADGAPESIAWASPQDGVLVMDMDDSGAVENGTEVLSENFSGFGFGNSMEALRSLDTNMDGFVDTNDASFGDLKVWRDANGDGVSQAVELLGLGDLGIAAISVQEETRNEMIDEQHVYAAGKFFYGNGASGGFVGVQLSPPSLADIQEQTGSELVTGGPAMTIGDVFLFAAPPEKAQTIDGFDAGVDVFQISTAGFGGGLVAGGTPTLVQGSDATASGSGGQFLFDTGTGALYWDVDGEGVDRAVMLATINGVSTLQPSDFLLF